jgi:ribose 5-phosphate isomerase A
MLLNGLRSGYSGVIMPNNWDQYKTVAARALDYIPDRSVIGLGSGRTTMAFICALGERVAAGLQIRGVPTSNASAQLATQLNIPLIEPGEVEWIDVAVDGADEVDPHGNLVKGLGGALVREKIVAASARKFVVVVSDEKLSPVLGSHHVLPVEVVPFGLSLCTRSITALGLAPKLRMVDGKPFISDNGNLILDLHIQPLERPQDLERALLEIPGVVDTGLFLGMKPTILIQHGQTVEVRELAAGA